MVWWGGHGVLRLMAVILLHLITIRATAFAWLMGPVTDHGGSRTLRRPLLGHPRQQIASSDDHPPRITSSSALSALVHPLSAN